MRRMRSEEDGSEEDGSEEDGGEEDGSGTRSCSSFHMRCGNVDVNCAKPTGSGERSKGVYLLVLGVAVDDF